MRIVARVTGAPILYTIKGAQSPALSPILTRHSARATHACFRSAARPLFCAGNPLATRGSPMPPLCSARARATVAVAMANLTVQYNLSSLTIAIPFLLSDGALAEPRWAADALKGAAFLGAFIGMLLFGQLADRVGRLTGLLAAVAVVLVAVAGAAAAPLLGARVWEALIVSRVFVGIGVGGIYPTSAALAAAAGGDDGGAPGEGEPARGDEGARAGAGRAAWAFFWQSLGSPLPYLLAMLLLAPSGPARAPPAAQAAALLGLGAAPAAAVFLLALSTARRAAPAGAAEGKAAAAPTASVFAAIRARPDLGVALMGTAGCWFLFDVSVYGIGIFAPEILGAIFGAGESLLALCWQAAVVGLLGVPACALAAVALSRLGARALMAWGFLANALSFLCLGAALVPVAFPAAAPPRASSFFSFPSAPSRSRGGQTWRRLSRPSTPSRPRSAAPFTASARRAARRARCSAPSSSRSSCARAARRRAPRRSSFCRSR